MEGFHKISGSIIRTKSDKPKVKLSEIPWASGQKGDRLYFNMAATDKFNLRDFDHAEIYIGEKALLVVPTKTKTSSTFNISVTATGIYIHARSLVIRAEMDITTIKRAVVYQTAEGLIVPLTAEIAPAVVKPMKFEVRGRLILPIEIQYRGSASWAKDKLVEVARGIVDDVDPSDVVLDTLTETPA